MSTETWNGGRETGRLIVSMNLSVDGHIEGTGSEDGETPNYLLSFGGAEVAATLKQHGLIDEYQLFVNPSVFVSGIPFFRHPANLTLSEARAFKTGMVALRYATVGQWVLLLFTVIFTYSLPHKVWG